MSLDSAVTVLDQSGRQSQGWLLAISSNFLLSIHLGGTLEWPKEPSLLGSSNLAIDRTEMLHPLGRT